MTFQLLISILASALAATLALGSVAATRRQELSAWAAALALTASALLEVCDLRALLAPGQWQEWKAWSLVAEGAAIPAWLLFSLTFARRTSLGSLAPLPRLFLFSSPVFLLAVFLLPLEQFYFSPDFADERILFLGRAGYVFSIGVILFLTYILVQLERTLSSLPRQERWTVKFEIVGAGTLMAMYLVYYSQGLLHRTLDMNLMPSRSAALALAAGLIAWSRLRGRGREGRIAVAPAVAFRSVVVLAVAVYLIGLGLLGEGMRYMGDAFPRTFVLLFGLAGGVGVVTALLSETIRRKVKVSLHKSFYRHKYDYRAQWLAFARRLSSVRAAGDLHGAVLAFYCETFALRGAALYLREGDVFRAVAAHEMAAPEESFGTDTPLVRFFDAKWWIFASRDDVPPVHAAHGPFLTRHGVSFVVPLQFEERLEGFIVLGAPINRSESFTYEDFDLMKMIAGHATSAVLSLRLTAQLSDARELAALGKVSAFVLHDLKNLVSGLGLMAENARDFIADPEFQADLLEDLDGTVRKMKGLMTRLRNLEEKVDLDLRKCDLLEVVREGAKTAGNGPVTVRGESVTAVIDPVEIEKVALNLILNALEATEWKGPVAVEVGCTGRSFIRVRDQGEGMGEEFIRTRLFKPFQTTKKKGFGIGLWQCRNIVEGHGGTIEVRSKPGEGTEFTVWLPAVRNQDQRLNVAEVVDGKTSCC